MAEDFVAEGKKAAEILAFDHVKKYYSEMNSRVFSQIGIAKKAKAKGLDISLDIETTPTQDLADRTESIIGPKGVAEKYREAYAKNGNDREKATFQIFREIIGQEWCEIPDTSQRVEQAIRTALVLMTEGVVIAPLDGVPKVLVSQNLDGSKFVDIYYAGPIRAAGGTATVLPLILGDYARALLGLDRYKPTDDEVERYVEECQVYEEIFSRQYRLSDDEVRKIVRGCPVCINGEPTEEREVSVNRNLQRVESNRVRGGACLVISEGIALKARKILNYARKLKLDWEWLEGIIKVEKADSRKSELKAEAKYLDRLAAGRPIFSYPMRVGGFRLRYGRSRNMGTMGKGIHPATMHLLDDFIAVATQLKVERPGKAAGICPVDSIEGPIVKLFNGNVEKLSTASDAFRARLQTEKVLFLGDMLVSFGDFKYSAHPLVPPGYCEEWWDLEFQKSLKEKGIDGEKRKGLLGRAQNPVISADDALLFSRDFNVPLHPKFLHYYCALSKEEARVLVELSHKNLLNGSDGFSFANDPELKALFERIGLPHSVNSGSLQLDSDLGKAFHATLGLENFSGEQAGNAFSSSESVFQFLSNLSGLQIRDKGGTFIGSRMGRPEASSPRKMEGNPHVLFPIGLHGGATRSINKAAESASGNYSQGSIELEVCLFKCENCNEYSCFPYCVKCSGRTKKFFVCRKDGKECHSNKCPRCAGEAMPFNSRKVDVAALLLKASQHLGMKVPDPVKGVKGMINEEKVCEPLEKGVLRSKHGLHIFRDGTVRYELINAPLTHFKPKEIGLTVEKAKELGYEKDIEGKELVDAGQIVELFPQDIVIHAEAGDFFLKVSRFADDLLEHFYGQERRFNYSKKEDLVGEFLLGLAPHTSAAIVARLIGYSKAKACFAHPYFHQCKRRNIDGDQDSLMLLMDGLLNFSQSYLPSHRGGRMDAPLVFTIALRPTEIDEEVHSMETCAKYPLQLYERALKGFPPEVDGLETVKQRLEKKEQYSGILFSHDTSVFDAGPSSSKYVQLGSMEDKIKAQARVQNMIVAVDGKDALERVMFSHFLPDIIGNARAFSRQTFRCTNCNTKYRRIPLSGNCNKCAKGNIILTIAQGSVRKYLKIAKEIVVTYGLSDYLKQRLDLVEEEIDSVFKNEKVQQKGLFEFV
ncbi:MAG: DNA polymerase II large subunit [Candidatus Diapherotrites archaeon]|nr:DNA polymerase II large subunit [Candidatus Diapherotrites archaeon]